MHEVASLLEVLARNWLAAAVLFTSSGLAACSSTTSPGVAEAPSPPPPAPTPLLDFAAIAGDWAGEGTDIRQPAVYQIEMTLDAEARSGANVGTVTYNGALDDLKIDCGGVLIASRVSGNAYVLTERITHGVNCISDGTVRLTYDAAAGTLSYEWYSPASSDLCAEAVLTRKE